MKRTFRGTLIAIVLLLHLPLCAVDAQNKDLGQLQSQAQKAVSKRQYALADSLYGEYVKQYEAAGLPRGFQYSEVLHYLVQRAANTGKIDKAIALQQQVIDIRKSASDCTYAQWATSVSDMASLYSKKGQYTQAIKTGEEALMMLKKKFGDEHHFYCIALANQASYYSARGETGDYQTAVKLGEEAVDHMKKGTPEYANAVNALVVYYSQTGDRLTASKLSAKARKEAKKRMGKADVNFATVQNNNAIRLANAGNYEEAIEYAKLAKENFEQGGQQHSLFYAKLLTNMATFYSHMQHYNEAATLLEQALPLLKDIVGSNHADYLRCMSDLAAVYRGTGNLEKAEELADQSRTVSRQMGTQDNLKYAQSLSKQGATFASNGNYTRAIEHEKQALAIYENRHDSINIAFSLGILANYRFSNNNHRLALSTAERSLAIFRKRGTKIPQWAQALNNTAILYYNDKQYEKAFDYGQQALKMYEEIGDTATAVYARIMANNGLFNFMRDSLNRAINVTQKAVDLHERLLGKDHPDNVPLLYNLAIFHNQANNRVKAYNYYQQALRLQSDQVRTNFLHLTSQEREKFWNQKSYVFNFSIMLAYLDWRQKESLSQSYPVTADAYNTLLFTKGILLNSDIDFKRLLKRTGDHSLLEKYNQLAQLRENEEDYYKQPTALRDTVALQHVKEEIYQLERSLVKGCKEYGNFTESLAIDAKQVAQSLKADEAAIEFADIYIQGMGTTYVALILRQNEEKPQLVRLFADSELRDLKYNHGQVDFFQALRSQKGIDEVYNDSLFGSMLWTPVMKHLQGVKNIYFSPTALFYQLGIEYLPCNATQRIGQLYNVYRVSSTKSLVNRQPAKPLRKATIFGGLNYDMDLGELRKQHDQLLSGHEDLLAMNTLNNDVPSVTDMQRTLDSLSVRGTVGNLPGTEHEAENIAEQLMQNGVKTKVYMHNEGTEEVFKSLSGKEQGILHIATHGFYFSESELKAKRQQLIFLNEQTDNLDNALNYSGMLLSGANYALQGNKLPNDLEDGILTAREIAQVDLGHAEMVVLSACQTGLGDIREDGVFGIQRGFKKAGAHTLLMSLWKVSDQATDLMMTNFYQHLIAGCSRYEAFAKAQQAVREGGFSNPYFWASFILLDGLE